MPLGIVEGVHRIAFDDGVGVLFDPAEMVASESLEVGAAVDKPHFVFAQPVDAVLRVVAVHDLSLIHIYKAATNSALLIGCESEETT